MGIIGVQIQMVRSRTRNGVAPEPIPAEMDPTGLFERLIQRLEHIGERQNAPQYIPPPRQTGDKLLERFRALRPERFDGMSEPWKAEQWIREMETIFRAIECRDHEKKRLAVFQLTYSAAEWWEAEEASLGTVALDQLTWEEFKDKFLQKYFLALERDKKEREFMDLVQGNKTM